MSLWEFEAWTLVAAALAFTGDNLMLRGELRGRWYAWAVGHVLYAMAFSMLFVAAIVLEETRAGRWVA